MSEIVKCAAVAGVPRYTYVAADGGTFVATVLLPSGRSVRGGAAPSRDQVSAASTFPIDLCVHFCTYIFTRETFYSPSHR